MDNDWKPTEQNIGQPVSNTYIPSIGTSHIYSKWYDVDTTKITSIKDEDKSKEFYNELFQDT